MKSNRNGWFFLYFVAGITVLSLAFLPMLLSGVFEQKTVFINVTMSSGQDYSFPTRTPVPTFSPNEIGINIAASTQKFHNLLDDRYKIRARAEFENISAVTFEAGFTADGEIFCRQTVDASSPHIVCEEEWGSLKQSISLIIWACSENEYDIVEVNSNFAQTRITCPKFSP